MSFSEWRLGDLLEIVKDTYKPNESIEMPYIGLEHIGVGTLTIEGMGNSKDVLSNKYFFKKGDILFGRLRPYFRKVVMPEFDGVCSTDIMVIRTKDPSFVLQEYLFYLMANKEMIDIASKTAIGTKMPRADWSFLKNITVNLPSGVEQKRITDVLSQLDIKSNYNVRINKTLEQLAQTIFKSWFIDFEPFQDGEFEESELGMIPVGWYGTLNDIATVKMGQSPPSDTYNSSEIGIPFYQGIRDFGTRFPSVSVYCSEPVKIAEEGEILLSVRAPVGDINITPKRCCIGRGITSITMKNKLNNHYLYYFLNYHKTRWQQYESGSVFKAITKKNITDFPMLIPPNEVISNFNEIVSGIDSMIYKNFMENIYLSHLRDTLLPKLMSGEIRVPFDEEEA